MVALQARLRAEVEARVEGAAAEGALGDLQRLDAALEQARSAEGLQERASRAEALQAQARALPSLLHAPHHPPSDEHL